MGSVMDVACAIAGLFGVMFMMLAAFAFLAEVKGGR